jgi:hypothetical protein
MPALAVLDEGITGFRCNFEWTRVIDFKSGQLFKPDSIRQILILTSIATGRQPT